MLHQLLIICLAAATQIDQFARIKIFPEGDLLKFFAKPFTFQLELAALSGPILFNSISKVLINSLAPSNVTIENADFKTMDNVQFINLYHDVAFKEPNRYFAIHAFGSPSPIGSTFIKLYIPLYDLADEHVLLPEYQHMKFQEQQSFWINRLERSFKGLGKICGVKQSTVHLTLLPIYELENLYFANEYILQVRNAHLENMLEDATDNSINSDQLICDLHEKDPRSMKNASDKCLQALYLNSPRGKMRLKFAKREMKRQLKKLTEDYQSAHQRVKGLEEVNATLSEAVSETKERKKVLESEFYDLKQAHEKWLITTENLQDDFNEAKTSFNQLAMKNNELEQKLVEREQETTLMKTQLTAANDLIQLFSNNFILAASFSDLAVRPFEEAINSALLKFTRVSDRYRLLPEYKESDLCQEGKLHKRQLYLEVFYSEGQRLQNWLRLAKTNDWRDQFAFESCYAVGHQDHSVEKVTGRLMKMKKDIERLEKRVQQIITELISKCEGIEEEGLIAYLELIKQTPNSQLDVLVYNSCCEHMCKLTD